MPSFLRCPSAAVRGIGAHHQSQRGCRSGREEDVMRVDWPAWYTVARGGFPAHRPFFTITLHKYPPAMARVLARPHLARHPVPLAGEMSASGGPCPSIQPIQSGPPAESHSTARPVLGCGGREIQMSFLPAHRLLPACPRARFQERSPSSPARTPARSSRQLAGPGHFHGERQYGAVTLALPIVAHYPESSPTALIYIAWPSCSVFEYNDRVCSNLSKTCALLSAAPPPQYVCMHMHVRPVDP